MSPVFRYRCERCRAVADRIVSIDDRDVPVYHVDDVCGETCNGKMVYEFVPTRQKPIIYSDTNGDPRAAHGGPREYAKWLKDNNKVDMGNASVDEFNAYMADTDNAPQTTIDKTAEKWAKRTMEALGSELYTEAPQNNEVRDASHLPEGLREKMGV